MKMKIRVVRNVIGFIAMFFVMSLGTSCGHTQSHTHSDDHDHSHATEAGEAHAHQGKEYTSAYICPMHCEGSGSDKPGNCPACEMDYVKNEKAKKE